MHEVSSLGKFESVYHNRTNEKIFSQGIRHHVAGTGVGLTVLCLFPGSVSKTAQPMIWSVP